MLQETAHCRACEGTQVCPRLVANVSFAAFSEEFRLEFSQFRVGSGVQNDQNRRITAGLAVRWKVQLFLPAALAGGRDCHTHLDFMGLLAENAVHLTPFLRVVLPAHWTLLCRRWCSTDGSGDDWLKSIASFLSGSVVDVVQPFPPQNERRQGLGTDAAVLQQTSWPDLIDGRHGLGLKYALILQPCFVKRSEAIKVRVSVPVQSHKLLEELQKIQPW